VVGNPRRPQKNKRGRRHSKTWNWAGSSVCVEEDIGVVVLTSQEKWDHLKAICQHWLDLIKDGEDMLDFKQLRLDRGFMVYVTQVYPAMKPYLKGFHLTLEN
jgi:hypothetical protein